MSSVSPLRLFALCLLFALAPHTASAQDAPPTEPEPTESEPSPEDAEKARMYYQLAAKHYEDGELHESAQMLEKAYELDPNPILAYNIGKAYDDAAELEPARTWYQTALDDPDLPEKERDKAQRAIARIDKTQSLIAQGDGDGGGASSDPTLTEAEDPAALSRRTHDGFFIRLAVGGGIGRDAVEDKSGSTLSLLGGGGIGSVGVGYTIADNLILHAEVFGAALIQPTAFRDDTELGSTQGRYELGCIGAGLTYYVMTRPSGGLYISAGGGLATLTSVVDGQSSQTQPGFGAEILSGYEWWISDEWGIGAGAQLIVATVPSQQADNHNTFAFGALFSATYN